MDLNRRKFVYLTGCAFCVGCQSNSEKKSKLAESEEAEVGDTGQDVAETELCVPEFEALQIPLVEHPELFPVGGWKYISFPDQLLHLLVIHKTVEEWIAVWKYCSHGYCALTWVDEEQVIQCPCHNSYANKALFGTISERI